MNAAMNQALTASTTRVKGRVRIFPRSPRSVRSFGTHFATGVPLRYRYEERCGKSPSGTEHLPSFSLPKRGKESNGCVLSSYVRFNA
jgi:hypothetical protein